VGDPPDAKWVLRALDRCFICQRAHNPSTCLDAWVLEVGKGGLTAFREVVRDIQECARENFVQTEDGRVGA
jgi:hypothetical protein